MSYLNVSLKEIQNIIFHGEYDKAKKSIYHDGIIINEQTFFNINEDIYAQVVVVKEKYIICAILGEIFKIAPDKTTSKLATGEIVCSYGPNAMYVYPQVNIRDANGNIKTTATIGYHNSNLRENINYWFNEQSEDFKNIISEVDKTYDKALLIYKPDEKRYIQIPDGIITIKEKIFISNSAELNILESKVVPQLSDYLTDNFIKTASTYSFKRNKSTDSCFGAFTCNNTVFFGNLDVSVVPMFKIG